MQNCCKSHTHTKGTLEFEVLQYEALHFEISFLTSWKLKQKVVTFFYERLLVEFCSIILVGFYFYAMQN